MPEYLVTFPCIVAKYLSSLDNSNAGSSSFKTSSTIVLKLSKSLSKISEPNVLSNSIFSLINQAPFLKTRGLLGCLEISLIIGKQSSYSLFRSWLTIFLSFSFCSLHPPISSRSANSELC